MTNIEELVSKIVDELAQEKVVEKTEPIQTKTVKYPLGENHRDLLKAKSGKSFDEITYEGVINETVGNEDLRTNGETLKLQAQVAKNEGKIAFADNLIRASEMVDIPDDEVLRIYNLLRPNRTDKQTLLENAKMLREKYGAENIAKLVEEAALVYAKRGITK